MHTLAVQISKRDGLSHPQAYDAALKQRPQLYSQFVKEVHEGIVYQTPVPSEYLQSGFLSRSEEDKIRKRSAGRKMTPAR